MGLVSLWVLRDPVPVLSAPVGSDVRENAEPCSGQTAARPEVQLGKTLVFLNMQFDDKCRLLCVSAAYLRGCLTCLPVPLSSGFSGLCRMDTNSSGSFPRTP